MVHLLQHSAGASRIGRRRMQCILLWFILSGIARDTLSAVDADQQTKSSSKYFSTGKSEDIALLKKNSKNLSVYKDFHSLPTLSGDKNKNSGNLLLKSHVADGISRIDTSNVNNALKRHDTIIPVIRFGRSNEQKKQSNSYSVIPYPRLGRSSQISYANEEERDTIQNSNTEVENKYALEMDSFEESGDYEEPKPRSEDYEAEDNSAFLKSGSEDLESEINRPSLERNVDELDIDYLIPQMRYGRSMLLFPKTKTEQTEREKPTRTFVLPYPRPGRANKYRMAAGNSEPQNLILPYPRPGRFDKTTSKRMKTNYKENQGYMLPSARLGRSTLDTLYELEGKTRMYSDDEGFLALKVNPLLLKSEERNLSEKPKDKTENTSLFIIPYPRPGKKSSYKMNNVNGKQKSNNPGKDITDYVLPYPRPGKRSARQQSQKIVNNNEENSNIQSQNFILPYPRPGRSMDYLVEVRDEINQNNINEVGEYFDDTEVAESENYGSNNIEEYDSLHEKLCLRVGRSPNMFKYEYLVQCDDATNSDMNDSIYKSSDETPDHLRYKRSTTVVPYPRFGRSISVVPYPRLGRIDSVVEYPDKTVDPYPSLEPSSSVFPYARADRSDSLVPYPRPGRSDAVVPYPRPGRSDAVVPYPRPGRSDAIIPYPRSGRTNRIIPYPRPGRANSVVPYPRPGRSSGVVPYPRPGRANGVVPYPRPGRSEAVVPYPRTGKSGIVPYPRPGRSDAVVPYPRPGRSESVVPYPGKRKSNVIPYPRPGRSDSLVPYPRPGRSNVIVPYPRTGKSLSVVPYPRTGRSEKISSMNSKTMMKNWLLPNIRPGRSLFNNEDSYFLTFPRYERSKNGNNQIGKEQFSPTFIKKGWAKDAVIPYPRLGRSKKGEYILPHPRTGKSESDIRNKRDITDTDTVIPYPRLGRSQKNSDPSSNVVHSVHKLNKHILTNAGDSVYLLPYPRPGRSGE